MGTCPLGMTVMEKKIPNVMQEATLLAFSFSIHSIPELDNISLGDYLDENEMCSSYFDPGKIPSASL